MSYNNDQHRSRRSAILIVPLWNDAGRRVSALRTCRAEPPRMNEERWRFSALHSPALGCFHSEDEAHLHLEHARRVDVGERRNRVRGCADGSELAERRVWYARVAVGRLAATEVVPVIEDVEALQPEQDRCAF